MYLQLKRIRSKVLVYLTHEMALPLLQKIRKPEVFPYTIETLRHFPKYTLGYGLFSFLEQRKLPLLPYYARHDIKHILLDYDTTDDGEVCLQCFMLGNGHISFPVVATVVYGAFTMPEHWKKFCKAFLRGRNSNAIYSWQWFEILKFSTASLKEKIIKI